MGGKRRVKSGLPRLLSRLNGREGHLYRRFGAALARDLGVSPADVAIMAEVGRVARLWLEYTEAAVDLDAARRHRRSGKGKPPGRAVVDRLSHRMDVASGAYAEALAALKDDPVVKRLQAEASRAALIARTRAGRGDA
jgi:hypothetical protein